MNNSMLCSAKMVDGTWDGNAVDCGGEFQRMQIYSKRPIRLWHVHCRRKIPIFKLTVTLSNLNRFSKFLHYRKACEICYKTHTTIPQSSKVETYFETQCRMTPQLRAGTTLIIQVSRFHQ